MSNITKIWIVGSIVTFVIAGLLWKNHKAVAAAFVIASPFPCPTGLPC